MPRYLKKYNENLKVNSDNINVDQEGEGALLNLVIKGISHLLPSLISKFGEKAGEHVGEAVGQIAKEQINKFRENKKDKQTDVQNVVKKMEGGSMDKKIDYSVSVVGPSPVKNKNKSLLSSYDYNPQIVPVAKKSTKGEGFNLAGVNRSMPPACRPCSDKNVKESSPVGGAFEVPGVKGGAFNVPGKTGAGRPRGRPRKMAGTGVVEMSGAGVDVLKMQNDHLAPFDPVDKIKDIIKNNNLKNNKDEKLKVLKTYNDALMFVMDKLGSGETNSQQLDNICNKIFGSKFGAVVASDQLPKKINDKYYIVNTDKSDQPGQHWMACTKKYIYDSFGRDASELEQYIDDRKLINKTSNRDQSINEYNCGQRCVAFLVCHHIHGDNIIKYI